MTRAPESDTSFGEVTGKMGYSITERANVLFAGSYLSRHTTSVAGLRSAFPLTLIT